MRVLFAKSYLSGSSAASVRVTSGALFIKDLPLSGSSGGITSAGTDSVSVILNRRI
jgi:hypothetical protein